jgi:hypothetical protein
MAALSDYAEDLLLTYLLTSSTVYVGLYTAAPSDAGGGTEVSGNGYARQACAFAGTSTSGIFVNSTGIVFTAAGGDWGTVTHTGIFDGSGNLLLHAQLAAAKPITNGDTASFTSGTLTVSLD